jgi:hypothetical protein
MLKFFLRVLLPVMIIIGSCAKSTDSGSDPDPGSGSGTSNNCGYHNGHKLYKGPDGGCYYINSNGNKTYVNRSECNC